MTPFQPGDSLHQWLRTRTAPLHRTLDSSPRLRALMQANLPAAMYQQALLGLLQAHAQTEPWLATLAHARPETLAGYESRQPALCRDIQALAGEFNLPALPNDATLPAVAPPALPTAADATEQRSVYVGMRYVIEGASQGARFITRRLQQTSPALLHCASSYWLHQSRMMEHWDRLITCLDDRNTPLNPQAVYHGASQVFHQFIAVFNSPAASA
jgi:heme oxygenase